MKNLLNILNPFKGKNNTVNVPLTGTKKDHEKSQAMEDQNKKSKAMNDFESLFTGKNILETTNPGEKATDDITNFLRKNHYSEGFHTGFDQHCVDFLHTGIGLIRSEFLDSVDKVTEQTNLELQKVREALMEIGDIMPIRKQVLEQKEASILEKLEELKLQKELAVDNEGRVAVAIKSYQLGFERGFNKYLDVQKQSL